MIATQKLVTVFLISVFAIFLTVLLVGHYSIFTKAQRENPSRVFNELQPRQIEAFASSISPEVRSIRLAQNKTPPGSTVSKDQKELREVPNELPFRKAIPNITHDTDSALAKILVDPMLPPILSFDGISSNDNAAVYGTRFLPPDPNGDVGPDHYVQATNSLIRIFNKKGTALTPPFRLSSLFAPLATICSRRDDGDPIVLYDQLSDRWILSQYCVAFPPFRQMIAISRTGDPTGSYFIYEFVMPNVKLNDYAKLAVWLNSYIMSTDEFLGSDYAGSGVFAFDKRKMLVGDPTASYIFFDLASPTTIRLGGLLPVDFEGIAIPNENPPAFFLGYTANEYGDAQDALRIFELRPNFLTYNLSTFSERSESPISVAAFDPTSNEGRTDIQQPAPGDFLDAQSDRLMYRATYRVRDNLDSIVVNQTVRTSPFGQIYRGGSRLYELRRDRLNLPAAPFLVGEQATISGGNLSLWMGSAAIDHQGNIGLAFSGGNEDKKPSIQYSGRLSNDPTGTLRAPQTLISGTGVQTAFGFRWGDYTQLSVDPTDDCTFWLTNEYYTQQSQEESPFGWLTRIGTFRFPECVNAPRGTIIGNVIDAQTGAPISGAFVATRIGYSRATDSAGSFGRFTFLPDSYILTATAFGYQSATATVTLTNGQTLTQNFALQPIPFIVSDGNSITAETCNLNHAADPGETVTIEISLRNTGLRDAANLTASMGTTGDITPQSPTTQIYGAIPVGGVSVSRPFNFTVLPTVPCGAEISLPLFFREGNQSLGLSVIRIRTGQQKVAFAENFDDTRTPQLPTGWTTSSSGAQQIWSTSSAQPQSIPNSSFSPAPNQIGINDLVSPSFRINSSAAELTFQNRYDLETTFLRNQLYDGGVLEIKIGEGPFRDILAAGGTFLSGGYDGILSSCCQNPLAGRLAWSGRSGINQTPEFVTTRVRLPSNALGQDVRLRWRVGTDIGTFREGQFIDNVLVTDGYSCCTPDRVPFVPFDFDGDGKTDLSLFRASDDPGAPDFRLFQSSSSSEKATAWGSVGDRPANADFDGDGKTDYAVFRPASGVWFILRSGDSSIDVRYFGLAQDKLVPSDYDGDGNSDIAVFRAGVWYTLRSSDSQIQILQFGIAGDLPVQSDFDGDGKSDIAVFRPATGVWYVLRSADSGTTIIQFGLNGDKPVVGDYDGDGKSDFAVFRPSERIWYLLRSRDGFAAYQFGLSDDKLLQADFDGDGKRDIAVYRQSTGVWYYIRSSNNEVFSQGFGTSGETAVPSIYVE